MSGTERSPSVTTGLPPLDEMDRFSGRGEDEQKRRTQSLLFQPTPKTQSKPEESLQTEVGNNEIGVINGSHLLAPKKSTGLLNSARNLLPANPFRRA